MAVIEATYGHCSQCGHGLLVQVWWPTATMLQRFVESGMLQGLDDDPLADLLADDIDLDGLLAEWASEDLGALLAEWASEDLGALLAEWGDLDISDLTGGLRILTNGYNSNFNDSLSDAFASDSPRSPRRFLSGKQRRPGQRALLQ
jgi:hypothetical protein